MIYAKTRMKNIPKTCKDCSCSNFVMDRLDGAVYTSYRTCGIVWKMCPYEKKKSGNWGYGKPDWCPLVEIGVQYDSN